MADIAKIVEELSTWSVMDIASLVKELEAKWGVTAAAPWWWPPRARPRERPRRRRGEDDV